MWYQVVCSKGGGVSVAVDPVFGVKGERLMRPEERLYIQATSTRLPDIRCFHLSPSVAMWGAISVEVGADRL